MAKEGYISPNLGMAFTCVLLTYHPNIHVFSGKLENLKFYKPNSYQDTSDEVIHITSFENNAITRAQAKPLTQEDEGTQPEQLTTELGDNTDHETMPTKNENIADERDHSANRRRINRKAPKLQESALE